MKTHARHVVIALIIALAFVMIATVAARMLR